VVLDEKQSLQKKGGSGDKLSAHILDAAARTKKCEAQLRGTTCDLHTHELQSAMRLTVGFLYIYCEM